MMEKIAILTSIMIIPCCATIYAFAETQEVAIGDSEAEVIEVLGKSQGKARSGDLDIMYYERGTVELKDGKVFNVKLVSEETAAERTAERLRQERARERTREAHRQELIEKGTAETERMLADPAYAEMSAQELVDYWNNFRASYPDVPIDVATYTAAQEQLRVEKEEALKQAAAANAAEKPPRPRVSGKKKKKMQRSGKWIWD